MSHSTACRGRGLFSQKTSSSDAIKDSEDGKPSLSSEKGDLSQKFDFGGLPTSTADQDNKVYRQESAKGESGLRAIGQTILADNSDNVLIDFQTGLLGVVQGVDNDGIDFFTDVIVANSFGNPTVIKSDERNSPGTRSYSTVGPELSIAIDDAGNNYNVCVMALHTKASVPNAP